MFYMINLIKYKKPLIFLFIYHYKLYKFIITLYTIILYIYILINPIKLINNILIVTLHIYILKKIYERFLYI